MASRGQSVTVTYVAWNTSTNQGQTLDAANHVIRLVKDGTSAAPTNAASEVDSTNAPGVYKLTLTTTEATADCVVVCGKSSTANVSIMPLVIMFEQLPTAAGGAANGLLIAGSNAATTFNGTAASGATPATAGLTLVGGAASTTGGGVAAPGLSATGGAGAATTNGAAAGATWTAGGTTTVSGNDGAVFTGTGNGNGSTFAHAGTGKDINGALTRCTLVDTTTTVTNGVTVTTNNDKTGYSLTQAFPTNFAALGISVGGHITTVDTTTDLTNAPTTGDFTAAMKTSLNAATPASVTGSVGSVTGAVGSVTGNVGGSVVGDVEGKVLGGGASVLTGTGVRAVDASGNALGTAANQTTIITDIGLCQQAGAAVTLPTIPANWIDAAGIAAGALNGKGDWLLAANYTAPPTAAQIATAILTDTTASDLATVGSIGHIIATQLGGALVNSVFTAAALANAPSGNTTVAGYAAGQDPATLVLDALAANHNTANTIGARINSAGSGADPLLNPASGYLSDSIGYEMHWLFQRANADEKIDTTSSPGWNIVYYVQGTTTELLRQRLLDLSGNPIKLATTIVAQTVK